MSNSWGQIQVLQNSNFIIDNKNYYFPNVTDLFHSLSRKYQTTSYSSKNHSLPVSCSFKEKWCLTGGKKASSAGNSNNHATVFLERTRILVCRRSVWLVLSTSSHLLLKSCVLKNSRFNKINTFYCIIKDILKWNSFLSPSTSMWVKNTMIMMYYIIRYYGLVPLPRFGLRSNSSHYCFCVIGVHVTMVERGKKHLSIPIKIILCLQNLLQGS